ncbi:DUF2934 domain-containing protein [Shinella sp.]|uniref:DUF2934 domain-containing protein n=1 Tax=Shinella sp. TaxID=1870904 RepID=UPI0029AEB5A3|nr:DUF2934 domain-containing protein [Shinella sp.]MDX3976128.1 DUF2934 domain-containing protein [Shinella sp.]
MQDERERRIKARAFELWQQEGSLDGRTLGHWLQPEREVQEEEGQGSEEDSTSLDEASRRGETRRQGSTPHIGEADFKSGEDLWGRKRLLPEWSTITGAYLLKWLPGPDSNRRPVD